MSKNLLSYLRTSGLLIILLFSSIIAFTQTGTIRGSVRDVNGLPLAGASVVPEGTPKGTITNTAGEYTLQVAPGTYVLIMSYVGMQTQQKGVNVVADGATQTDFVMVNSGELTILNTI